MISRFTRALAVGITATLVSVSVLAAPNAMAAPKSTPTSCDGVWVAVQLSDDQKPALGCATDYSTNTKMLESAGFEVKTSDSAYGLSLDQIDGNPETVGGDYYWYQASAPIGSDGKVGDWAAGSGFGVDKPDTKAVSGFRLTNWKTASWPPPGPELASVPVAKSDPDPAPAPGGSDPAPSASTASAAKAAKWLASSVTTSWDSAGAALDAGLALSTRECAYSSKLKSIRAYLLTQADDYSSSSAYAAAKLAVFASTVGDDPSNFGGIDLGSRITADVGANGQLGTAPNFAFGQALGMIGLKRTGTAPTPKMVEYLISLQMDNGAWGFGTTADPDATALALTALSDSVVTPTAEITAAIAKAKTWAAGAKQPAGYWENYSPVDSTSLLGAALKAHGVNVSGPLAWMGTQQLTNGAFPNELNGTTANQMATANAMYLLTSKTYATVSAPLSTCRADDTSGKTLANTGTSASWPLGIAGVGFVALGAALVRLRRTPVEARRDR